MVVTDSPFHNGPGGRDPYDPSKFGPYPPPEWDTVMAQLAERDIPAAGVSSGNNEVDWELTAMAIATDAVDPDGPLVAHALPDGSDMADRIMSIVRRWRDDVPLDVVLSAEGPGASLVTAIRPTAADPPDAATLRDDGFDSVVPGTTVHFEVDLQPACSSAAPSTGLPLHLVLRTRSGLRLGTQDMCLLSQCP